MLCRFIAIDARGMGAAGRFGQHHRYTQNLESLTSP
jgi:hypothetical protein